MASMDVSISESASHWKDLKPKTKLDFLAEKVLLASGMCSELPCSCFDSHDQPYLGALEKVLGIDHGVNAKAIAVPENNSNGSTHGLLTCTNIPGNSQHCPKFQRIPARTQMPECASPKTSNCLMSDVDITCPCLEDYVPFSEDFYRFVGQMIVCAFSSAAGPYKAEIKKETGTDDGHQKDHYSLYHSIDAIRVTHIWSVLIDINVIGFEKNENKYSMKWQSHENAMEIDRVSFLDLLLHYTEGNSNVEIHDEELSGERPTSALKSVPLLNAIFKHFAALPHLESHVHAMTRFFRASAPTITSDGNSALLRLAHMEKTEEYQQRLEEELRRHIFTLERITGMVYERGDSELRTKSRLKMGTLLHSFSLSNGMSRGFAIGGFHPGVENTGAAFVDPLLKIILRILQGIKVCECNEFNVPDSYKQLLHEVLLPLHKPSGMTLWRDQQPLLALYHKTLVQCIGAIVSLDKRLIAEVIKHIIHPDVWPLEGKQESKGAGSMANTPKLVLLLHEIDTYISLLDLQNGTTDGILSDEILPLVLRLCSCISSDNSRSSERALEFFKNKSFKTLVRVHLRILMRPLLSALCRVDSGMDVPWNPTVRKMTLIVLKDLESSDLELFESSFRDLFSIKQAKFQTEDLGTSHGFSNTPLYPKVQGRQTLSAEKKTLKQSMGDWRPPLKSVPPHKDKADIATNHVTSSMPPPMSRMPHNVRNKAQPPLTITGVAPWAMTPTAHMMSKKLHINNQYNEPPSETDTQGIIDNKSYSASNHNGIASLKRKDHSSTKLIDDSERVIASNQSHSRSEGNDSVSRLREYMEKLKSPSSGMDDESDEGISSWAKAQMAESPMLLPTLKFHDLVFGDVLGTGAFSTVKYARQITKGKTRSQWPEYAVKVVSTQKIEELGYEKSINREIAILGLMGHPCISRLISSFRFRDGAYLVLEYASGGDLHSLLKRNGSINEDSTRFIIGEVVSGLHYIHELGFVFGDLKPENVLITESGHIKLTDFGACRPLTDNAKLIVKEQSKNNIRSLRNGDWHSATNSESKNIDTWDDFDMEEEEDERIEGTTAYLPPEVVMGGMPSKYADSWALGCLFFQCLSGRPPLLDACETSTRQKIVSFELSSSTVTHDDFFDKFGATSFSELAKSMIRRLLSKIPHERPSMSLVATDAFFLGENVFSYYKGDPHPIDPGKVGPSPDASWSRRQFSSIWAPQPKAYVIPSAKGESLSSDGWIQGPITEKTERDAFFLSTVVNVLTQISET